MKLFVIAIALLLCLVAHAAEPSVAGNNTWTGTNTFKAPGVNGTGLNLMDTAGNAVSTIAVQSGSGSFRFFVNTNGASGATEQVNIGNGQMTINDMITATGPSNEFTGLIFGNTGTSVNLVGTTAADNSSAGVVGEYVTSLIAIGSAVNLANTAISNVTSIVLTAGDWDVQGDVTFSATSITTSDGGIADLSTVNLTIAFDGSEVYAGMVPTANTSQKHSATLPMKRVNVTTTTTVYLEAECAFSAGSVVAYGYLGARRRR